jgi:NAD(P)-dependent dehydrogenase (short-subunit alcohol dehydrogenase family)
MVVSRERGGAVLVTGATGGIGRAVVHTLHAAGWDVALLDLAEEPLRALAAELDERRPGSASFTAADAAEESDVAAWVEKALAEYGAICGLVNVAGLWRSQPFTNLTMADIDTVLHANLRTALICCRLACEPMIAQGAGSIVNFASTAGEYGSISPAAHYAAAKGAVIALTKSLARELSPRGIRVNAISPGPVDTVGLTAGSSATSDETAARTLLGRLGTPQEIADGVAFLVSDESSFITGHVLRVNGGSLL